MASMTVGELLFKMTGDSSQLKKEWQESEKQAKNSSETIASQYKKIEIASRAFGEESKTLQLKQDALRAEMKRLIDGGIDPASKKFVTLSNLYRTQQIELDKTAKKTSILSGTFGKLAGLVAIGAIVSFGKKITKLASDATETGSKFEAVFAGMSEKANETATTLSDTYDLTITSTKDLLAKNGDLLQAFGLNRDKSLELSKQVVALSADLVSFKNIQGGIPAASDAITKAMFGEAESAKTLGLVLSDSAMTEFAATMGKNWESLSKGERAFLIVQKAAQDSKNAIGDYSKTQESFANTMRRLDSTFENIGTALGQQITPGLADLSNAFIRAAKNGGPLLTTLQNIGIVVSDVASGLAAVVDFFSALSISNEAELASAQSLKLSKLATDYGKNIVSIYGSMTKAKAAAAEGDQKAIELLKQYKIYSDIAYAGSGVASKSITEGAKLNQINEKRLENLKKSFEERREENAKTSAAQQAEIDLAQKTTSAHAETNKVLFEQANYWNTIVPAANQALASIGQMPQYINSATAETSLFAQAMSDVNQYWDSLTGGDKAGIFASGLGQISNMISAIGALQQQTAQNRIDALDAQMKKELEAAGVADTSAVQSAELELAKAKETGDAVSIQKAQDALTRAKIEEKYAKKKAQLEFEMQMQAWKMQRLNAYAQGAQAILSAYSSAAAIPVIGWVLAPIAAAAAAVVAGIQIATVNKSKPSPPAFETGGIIPGSQQGTIIRAGENNKAEGIFNQSQMQRLLDIAEGKAPATQQRGVQVPAFTTSMWMDEITKASRDGRLVIMSRSVQSK